MRSYHVTTALSLILVAGAWVAIVMFAGALPAAMFSGGALVMGAWALRQFRAAWVQSCHPHVYAHSLDIVGVHCICCGKERPQ